ncbi:hypothetical protein N825_34965 [Skermanella stibiiresistens SB22]|uniref:TIR domain-containing protein n=1 Tax=Skermanella stibiiresistens SB22 TaxID=1385369 RepID=W9HA15_9PROT|nr:toll/interleukin-1 receptor domain-containing protein [Skermanella stibiiresistens]EWY40658.1 hypothetical protein N825_34965 [Skermanella stibiiresistens SB22]
MGESYDIFFSLAHADREAAAPVVKALRDRGLKVFHHETEIAGARSITERIVNGLGHSRMLVAWYSKTYPTQRACQWELTRAIIAAQREVPDGGAVERRVVVLNPETGVGHLQPADVLASKFIDVSAGRADDLARRIAAGLDELTGEFGEIQDLRGPSWHGGNPRAGSNHFVGRFGDMWRIHTGLSRSKIPMISGGGLGLVLLQGMGGIGKTLLAEEYARRFGAAYPGGVFWLSAVQGQDLGSQIGRIAGGLGLGTAGLAPDEVAGMLKGALAARPAFLWIVDDLPPDATAAELNAWSAPTANGATLVTTRNTQLDGSGTPYRLGVLSDDEALELLTSRLAPRPGAEAQAAGEILTLLGNHALAVDVARAAVRKLSYEGFLARLRDPDHDATELAAKLAGESPTGHTPSIVTTLLDSIKRVDVDSGMRLLHLAALLAPAPIPISLVTSIFALLSGDANVAAVESKIALEAVTREALAEHITGDDHDKTGAVSVHLLVSRTLRFHGYKPPFDLREAAVAVLVKRMSLARDIRKHDQLLPEIPHVLKLTEVVSDASTCTLLLGLGRFNYVRGAYADAEADFRRSLDVAKHLLGPEHPHTLNSMNNLAVTLQARGNHAGAEELQMQELALSRQLLGAEHPTTLQSLNNLAEALQARGDYRGAEELQNRVLALNQKLLGTEHPDTLSTMSNLAETLQARGDHDGAEALHKRVLALGRRTMGHEHPEILLYMNRVALSLMAQGELIAAQRLEESVLDCRRKLLGPEHPETLVSQYDLARIMLERGERDVAFKLAKTASEGLRERLGIDHWQSWAAKGLVAACRAGIGNIKALSELHEAVERLKELRFPDAPEVRWLTKWLIKNREPVDESRPLAIDPLRLVFLLALNGRLPLAELASLTKPRNVTAALDTLKPPTRRRDIWLAEILKELAAKYSQVEPDPLWRGWMEKVNGEALDRLTQALEDYLAPGVPVHRGKPRVGRSERA